MPEHEESKGQEEETNSPPAEDLDEDPAYNPDEPGLKDIKGG
jgi:hypothetical protein